MENHGIDTTLDVRPYLKCLRAAGITFVCRYMNPPWISRGLTRAEAVAISEAGLSNVALYEWGTYQYTLAYFTYHQGQLDAVRAYERGIEVGMPSGRPIYFTVDMQVPPAALPQIGLYFEGVAAELHTLSASGTRYHVGAYGGYDTVAYLREAGRAEYLFQTYAWSQGSVLTDVNLYQSRNDVNTCGFPNDLDVSWGNGGGFKVV